MSIKARDIMTPNAVCVRTSDTVLDAARQMADLDVGALPICGEDDRLKGMLTDRDIVLKVVAAGKEPLSVTAGDLAQDDIITVDADEDAEKILRTMSEHQVRRLPVIEAHRLVGIVAVADVARALNHPDVGTLLAAISAS